MIPFFGLDRQYQNLRKEILDVTDQVYSSGQVLDGYYTRVFEDAIAQRCNREYAVSVNSATTGLFFAMQCAPAADIDNEVLIPSLSFPATLNAANTREHLVRMCDVGPDGLIDFGSLPTTLSQSRVAVIMYVNLFGNTVNWERFNLETKFFGGDNFFVIEDAAQSFGASSHGVPSGKMGDVSVLSFDPTKNLPNYGSGGMVLTDDPATFNFLLNLRNNCKEDEHAYVGYNSKMSEADCAQMMVKLAHFDDWQKRRTAIAEHYNERLAAYVDLPGITAGTTHAWHKYVIRTPSRDRLQLDLAARQTMTRIHYEKSLPEYDLGSLALGSDNMLDDINHWEVTAFCHECLSLPIYPELTDAEVETVVSQVRGFFSA